MCEYKVKDEGKSLRIMADLTYDLDSASQADLQYLYETGNTQYIERIEAPEPEKEPEEKPAKKKKQAE